MAIEELKRIFQIPLVRSPRKVTISSEGKQRKKPQKEKRDKEKGTVDIKV
ncbi:MAG: hypothetical protein HZA17_01660 [Nitrospirae bacterium]|nr:hypothetical protein [Nitrospirota bacterium]